MCIKVLSQRKVSIGKGKRGNIRTEMIIMIVEREKLQQPWHGLSQFQHTELFNRKIQNLCSGLGMCICLREKARVRCNYPNMFFQRAPRNGRRHTESKQTIHTAYLCMLLSWCAGQ